MKGRHALVVGADAYADQPLVNAVGDASRVAAVLRSRGFEVDLVLDPGRDVLVAGIEAFRERVGLASCALVYLAGHAVERFGAGYFLPIDMSLPATSSGLVYGAIGLKEFVTATNGARSRVVVLDACRDWPEDAAQRTRIAADLEELASAERDWPDLLLAFSTSATERAGDGEPGAGSAFTAALCRNLMLHGPTVDDCFRRVSREVAAPGRQQPWTYSSLRESLSFSDLPRFVPVYRLAVPNSEQLSSAWSVPNGVHGGLVAGMGDRLAWRIDLTGLRGVPHRAAGRLVGAATVQERLLLAEDGGGVFAGTDVGSGRTGLRPLISLQTDPTFGMASAADGRRAVHYGTDHVTVLSKVDGVLTAIGSHDVGFDVYCSTFLADGSILVAGGQGRICELSPSGASFRELCRLGQHVNALASSRDGDRVFAVGQHGLAVELDREGRVVRKLLDGRPLTTAAGLREELMQVCDADVAHAYLFDPSALDEEIIEQIEEHVSHPAYAGCAHAPTLPIFAIGTSESTILLLDSRDGQILQEIDTGSGFTVQIANLHFLQDDTLAVVDGRGNVTFFRARWEDRAGPAPSRSP